jgi:ABC-2 type transport system permease protein
MFAAIYIMWLRHLKRYFRSRARIVASLGQPLLLLVALGYGMNGIYRQARGGDYTVFLTPGIVAMSILFTATFSGIELLWDRQFGFLKETLVAPVPRIAIMIGRTLGGATVATFQGLIVIGICMAMPHGFRPANPMLLPVALMFMILIGILFTAFGNAVGSVLEDFQGFQLIMNFIIMPIFFLSGALFPLDPATTPKPLLWIARINPLAYGVDGLRRVLIGQPAHFGLGVDLCVLPAVAAAVVCIGAYLFSRIQL